jgi:hypothetical protein
MKNNTQNTENTVVATATEVAPNTNTKVLLDGFAPEVVPSNAAVQYYFDAGYTLVGDYRTRNRDDAKDHAKALRKDGTKQTAYITLHGGWFGVFIKDAPAKEAKEVKGAAARPEIRVEVEGFSGTTKEARAFARLILEAAKNAEFDYDLQQATATKEAKSE